MNWKKINAFACMEMLREFEKDAEPTLQENVNEIIYSDGEEELKISYRRLIG